MQVKKQSLELDIEQWTDPNWDRSMSRLYVVTLLILLTCRVQLGWIKYKLESRLPREISVTSDMQVTTLLWQKVKRN